MKFIEPLMNDPSNQRPKARPLYELHMFGLHDLAMLHHPKLDVAIALEEGEENLTGILY